MRVQPGKSSSKPPTARDPQVSMSKAAPPGNRMSRYKITRDLESSHVADMHLAKNVKKDELVLMRM